MTAVGCDNKLAFPTFTQARKTAARIRRRKEEILEPYSCKTCGKFHVGHPAIERAAVRVRRRLGRLARAVGAREISEATDE